VPSTNTIYPAGKSERGEENSIHRELKNERPKTRKLGEGTKNYEQALSSEYRPSNLQQGKNFGPFFHYQNIYLTDFHGPPNDKT